jgi:sugar-specific transcriptional regulator TrmB
MDNTNSLLKNLGLNQKERKIYLFLLQSGPQSIQKIAKATTIPRSTVYQRIESLKKDNLVIAEIGEKGEVIRPLHPSVLKDLIERRAKKIQELQESITTTLPFFEKLYQPDLSKTKVLYFDGVKGVRRMIMNYEMEAKKKDLYGYTMDIEKVLGVNFIKQYHKKFFQKGYRDHYIMNDKREHRDFLKNVHKSKLYKRKRIFIRTLPTKIFDPHVSVSIYDDKYAISLIEKGKPFGVIIQNEKIVKHQLEIFNILWKQAKHV